MTFSFICEPLLHCMCQRMTEIKQHPLSGIKLVFLHHLTFDIHTSCNYFRQMIRKSVKTSGPPEQRKKLCILDAAILDDFSHSVMDVTLRKCFQHIRINQDFLWLIECPYKIFAFFQVNCYFSSDRGIHLSQQGSRNLYEWDSPQIRCRRKSGQVSDTTSSEGKDQVASGNSRF